MIFYFSGAGNSYYLAESIANGIGDKLISITECMQNKEFTFPLGENEKVGFVFPVHFWGVPYIVTEFIKHLHIKNTSSTYVWAAYACGGSTGNTAKMISNLLKNKHINLSASFSCKFVDIFVPFFRIPPKDEQDNILEKATNSFPAIIEAINENQYGDFDRLKGKFPALATGLMYPLYSYYRNTAKFRVSDICIACKKCEKLCPTHTIEIIEGKPVWKNKKCTLCFACLHICPAQAINYGKVCFIYDSKNRGRYRNPYGKKGY